MKAYRALGRFRRGAPFRPWLLRSSRTRHETDGDRRGGARTSRCAWPTRPARGTRSRPPRRNCSRATGARSCSPRSKLRDEERLVVFVPVPPRAQRGRDAQTLGLKLGTVKSRTSRALAQLRQEVERGYVEHELRALPIAFPDEPDLAPRVLARLDRPVRRWWLVPALAALAVAGALLAIRRRALRSSTCSGSAASRCSAWRRSLARPVRSAVLGREVSLATAQRAVDFPLPRPARPVHGVRGRADGQPALEAVSCSRSGAASSCRCAQKQVVRPGLAEPSAVEVRGSERASGSAGARHEDHADREVPATRTGSSRSVAPGCGGRSVLSIWEVGGRRRLPAGGREDGRRRPGPWPGTSKPLSGV